MAADERKPGAGGTTLPLISAGQVIFREGDPGGDLLVIEEGRVEVFRDHEGKEVPLTSMGVGEVIGLFTCINQQPRTASTRAITEVRLRRIPFEQIKKSLGTMPKWFAIILKEYGNRLTECEDTYMKQWIELEHNADRLVSPVATARLFCSALLNLSRFLKKEVEGAEWVSVPAAMDEVTRTLGLKERQVTLIRTALTEGDLIPAVSLPGQNEKHMALSEVEKLRDFPGFCNQVLIGRLRPMVNTHFSHKAIRVGRAMVSWADKAGHPRDEAVSVPLSTMEEELQRVTSVNWARDGAEEWIPFDLLSIDNTKGGSMLTFTPGRLEQTIGYILDRLNYVYHRIPLIYG